MDVYHLDRCGGMICVHAVMRLLPRQVRLLRRLASQASRPVTARWRRARKPAPDLTGSTAAPPGLLNRQPEKTMRSWPCSEFQGYGLDPTQLGRRCRERSSKLVAWAHRQACGPW